MKFSKIYNYRNCFYGFAKSYMWLSYLSQEFVFPSGKSLVNMLKKLILTVFHYQKTIILNFFTKAILGSNICPNAFK